MCYRLTHGFMQFPARLELSFCHIFKNRSMRNFSNFSFQHEIVGLLKILLASQHSTYAALKSFLSCAGITAVYNKTEMKLATLTSYRLLQGNKGLSALVYGKLQIKKCVLFIINLIVRHRFDSTKENRVVKESKTLNAIISA